MSQINFHNIDCEIFMKDVPDGHYDLAVVDPNYGSDNIIGGYSSGKGGGVAKQKKYNNNLWKGGAPTIIYFDQLFRISKHQIIWGANHLIEQISKNSSGWIFWNKMNGDVSFSDGELAYTSFNKGLRMFSYRWSGMLQQDMKNKEVRIHPTQKPVALYRWILQKYAKPGYKILDTHGGSMSIAIACDMEGFDLDVCEIDKDYFDDGIKRFNIYKQQCRLF